MLLLYDGCNHCYALRFVAWKDGEAYNVANEKTYISIRDMAEFVVKNFNPERTRVVIQPQEGLGYSPTTKLRLSTERIIQLGWELLRVKRDV